MGEIGLLRIYRRLLERYGHAGWWPAETAFEVCLGAILTQNTAWTNVEKTLAGLRSRRLLSFAALSQVRTPRLASLLHASGTFRVKARRVAAFLGFLAREYRGRVSNMRREEPQALRRKLLTVNGIGPETADSIALYAARRPFFVVDAYTRRIFSRLGLFDARLRYDAIQAFFMDALPRDAALFNDYHAQIVRLAKEACRKRPNCPACPLEDLCEKRGL